MTINGTYLTALLDGSQPKIIFDLSAAMLGT
jgi:hypothetical protein